MMFTAPSGRTPQEVCRESADFWDLIDRLAEVVTISGGAHDGQTLADVLGSESEVQQDLRAVADWLDRLGAP